MYLLDTNVLSELRKKQRMNTGVRQFMDKAVEDEAALFISVITVGELRSGVDLIRHRGDAEQAVLLENWLRLILEQYLENILEFGVEEAQLWGHLRVPHHENTLDKQIAATALINDLTLVTRNVRDFQRTGVRLLDPFDSRLSMSLPI